MAGMDDGIGGTGSAPSREEDYMTVTRRAAGVAASCAAAALALAACGASGEPATSARTQLTTTSTGTTTTTQPAALALGTAYASKDGAVTLTVQSVKSVVREVGDGAEGMGAPQLGGAKVKACVAGGDGKFTWDSWTAADPTGIQFFHYGPSHNDIKPIFPSVTSTPVGVGKCVAGWVFFELSKGATIIAVTWTSGTDTATWNASA